MTDCSTQLGFSFPRSSRISVTFDEGHLTQDGGLLLLRQVDGRHHLTRRLAGTLREWRDVRFTSHSLHDLVRERVFAIAQGYEDCNDVAELRFDPLFLACCDRGAKGRPLASQPSLSRFERRSLTEEVDDQARSTFVDHFIARCRAEGRVPQRIVLDLDSTDDPTHGQQPLAFFNGHYGRRCYQQVYLFTSDGDLLWAKLASGTGNVRVDGLDAVRAVVGALRKAFPRINLILRADNGFATPALYDWCEDNRVRYVVNCGTHSTLCQRTSHLVRRAEAIFEEADKCAPVQVFGDFEYQAKSWRARRRVVAKAQRTPVGPDQRFVVTNLRDTPAEIYKLYAGRGLMENWIKDIKRGLDAGKLSSTAFLANELRLLLFGVAYQLLHELRRKAPRPLHNARIDTIRLRLLRVAARVKLTARRLWVRFSEQLPARDDWIATARAIGV